MEAKDLKYKIGNRSLGFLKAVDAKLIIVVSTYLAMGKRDLAVTYGARTQAEQLDAYNRGASKVKVGKHMMIEESGKTAGDTPFKIYEGNAIDIGVYVDGKISSDKSIYIEVTNDMKLIASHFGWLDLFNWGVDFNGFFDPYHISVKEAGDGGIK